MFGFHDPLVGLFVVGLSLAVPVLVVSAIVLRMIPWRSG
jgi:hypothetical protein